MKVLKTRTRTVHTLHVGLFRAREVFLICRSCAHTYRSEELCALVPPGANFGYDVMIYAGQALFLRHRNEEEVVADLAQKNVQISPREVSLLGMKFVVHLALTHQRRAAPSSPKTCRPVADTYATSTPHVKEVRRC